MRALQIGLMVAPNMGLICESALALVVPFVTIALLRAELLLVPSLFFVAFIVAIRRYSDTLLLRLAERTESGTWRAKQQVENSGGVMFASESPRSRPPSGKRPRQLAVSCWRPKCPPSVDKT